jgi:hypothetical protein
MIMIIIMIMIIMMILIMYYENDNNKIPNNEHFITRLRDEARMCFYNDNDKNS